MTRTSTQATRPEPRDAAGVRHPLRWVAVAVLAVLAAMLVNTVVTNENFRWGTVAEYLFAGPVLGGLRNTLVLTALAMAVGIAGGIGLAVMRLSPNPVLSAVAAAYLWVFRRTPLIQGFARSRADQPISLQPKPRHSTDTRTVGRKSCAWGCS